MALQSHVVGTSPAAQAQRHGGSDGQPHRKSRRRAASAGAAARMPARASMTRAFFVAQADLLKVLERPSVPLHTNGAENNIRCQVTRRKISAIARSGRGRAIKI